MTMLVENLHEGGKWETNFLGVDLVCGVMQMYHYGV